MDSLSHYALPAAVTLAALFLYAGTTFNVGRSRGKYKIAAPAIAGHPAFDRAYRVQMNTLEQMAGFLPTLWLFAAYGSPMWAAAAGGIWIGGRAWYAFGYARDPRQRAGGFMTALFASTALWIGATWEVLRVLLTH